MTYNELKFIVESKNMLMRELDAELGMARNGIKRSFEGGSFPLSKIPLLCQRLGLSPNQLFDWEESPSSKTEPSGNVAGSEVAIIALRDELRELRAMLKEKDQQINRLMSLLDKAQSLQVRKVDGGYPFVVGENPVQYEKERRGKK